MIYSRCSGRYAQAYSTRNKLDTTAADNIFNVLHTNLAFLKGSTTTRGNNLKTIYISGWRREWHGRAGEPLVGMLRGVPETYKTHWKNHLFI